MKKSNDRCSYCGIFVSQKAANMHKDSHPSKILEWLYLGSYMNAQNKKDLTAIKADAILNCAIECKNKYPEEYLYCNLNARDSVKQDSTQMLSTGVEFLEECCEKGLTVFVHCMLGKSRSSSVVIAYLIKNKGLDYKEAYKFVKERRSLILPNIAFVRALKEYK